MKRKIKKRARLAPNKKFRKALGKKLLRLRSGENISQAQLAFESGIGREQVGRIERGEQSPTVDILVAIADVLKMTVKDLLDFEY